MAFGTFEDHHHTRVPGHRLVENRARLDVFQLNRYGAFVKGAVTDLRWGEKGYRLAARTVDVFVNGNRVPVDWDVQGRPWFLCPLVVSAAGTFISTSSYAVDAPVSTIRAATWIGQCLAFIALGGCGG